MTIAIIKIKEQLFPTIPLSIMVASIVDSINVNAICEQAGVGRTTFYRHLDSKNSKNISPIPLSLLVKVERTNIRGIFIEKLHENVFPSLLNGVMPTQK